MSSGELQLPDRTEWRAQNMRMIAFTTDSQLSCDQDWWLDLAGSQPETTIRKPQLREASGFLDDVTALFLEVDPFRVKWTIGPRIDPDNLPQEFPTLGPAFDCRDRFVELMSRWLERCPQIKRLSFVGNLIQLVESKEEAYQRLNAYLRCVEVDPGTSDFMYRLNRQRDSQANTGGLRINRLCTWSSAKLTFGVQARSAESGETVDLPIQQEQVACILGLDINTVPDSTGPSLPQAELTSIFSELVDVGLQAAEQGDVE